MDAKTIFHSGSHIAPLGLIVPEGARELGEKINNHLVSWAKNGPEEKETFIIESECPRFSSGDGKGMIKETVRGKDLYFVVDIGNYSCQYTLFDRKNSMSPDDHFMDLKRLIQATSGKAHRISVIMPLLYGGRQHRRSYRESLDCAVALQELQAMGVSNIITFDAHDARVQNAAPLMGFDNVMPTYQVMKAMFKHIPDFKPTPDSFMVISPDEGAINRNMYYASVLGVNLGMFYKRRDYSRVVNGRNPIVAHEYLGESVEGKDVFIADDIISSGESMLDVAKQLKDRGAARVFVCTTFGLFTNGMEIFDDYYNKGYIDRLITTNLTYLPPETLNKPYFVVADMSKFIALIIDSMNHDISIGAVLDPTKRIHALMEKHKKKLAEKK